MIKPPSQQLEYTLIFSGDPSLVLPSDQAERAKALEVARETGQWAPLIRSGEQPTLFHVRPVHGMLLDWLLGEMRRRSLIAAETNVLALRLALRRVEGLGEHKVELERIGAGVGNYDMATTAIVEALYSIEGIGNQVVQELGDYVFGRALGGLRPKS
jgi:hypothetical protein